jgi:DNA polymerase III subunit epsilon
MTLKLNRPLAFIDLETTGLNLANDRIVEISILKLMPDQRKEIITQRLNPEMMISAEATSIHGISNEDVKNEPAFAKVAATLNTFIANSDLSGYNIVRFDLPLLVEEFLRSEVDFSMDGRKVIDVMSIFKLMEKRDLSAAYKFYCDKEIENKHSAEGDIIATQEVLMAQIEKYEQLTGTVDHLYEFTGKPLDSMIDMASRIVYNNKKEPVFNFGKYKDKTLYEIFEKDPSYYHWMLRGDFPLYTKKKMTEYLLKWKNENR